MALPVWAAWILICTAPHAAATTYYVRPGGNDLNSGLSPQLAWKTITKVNNAQILAGDSVLFEGGQVFAGTLYNPSMQSGTAQNPVVFGSYGSGRATISSGTARGAVFVNVGGIVFRDLIVAGAGITLNNQQGVHFYNNRTGHVKLDYIVITNVEVYGYNKGGIYLQGDRGRAGYSNISITHCDLHHNGDHGIRTEFIFPVSGGSGYGFINVYIAHCVAHENSGEIGKLNKHTGNGIVVGNGDNVLIEYCVAHGNGQGNVNTGGGPVGIWVWDTRNGTIQYCESYNNRTGSNVDGGGFDIDGGSVNCVMQYNYSHDNDGPGYLFAQFIDARPMLNNVARFNISENDCRKNGGGVFTLWRDENATGAMQGIDIYNNTVYLSQPPSGVPAALRTISPQIVNLRVFNNIFSVGGSSELVSLSAANLNATFRGNTYHSTGTFSITDGGTPYTSLAAWRTARNQEKQGSTSTGFQGDPLLTLPGQGGTIGEPVLLSTLQAYRLLIGSPSPLHAVHLQNTFGLNIGSRDFFSQQIPAGGGLFAGAYAGAGVAFPVSWLGVSARRLSAQQAEIRWDAVSDQPVQQFEILRRSSGEAAFRVLESRTEWMEPFETASYAYTDPQAGNGEVWYQIRSTDADGGTSLSPVISLGAAPETFTAVLAPNPASGPAYVQLGLQRGSRVALSVSDPQGRVLASEQLELPAGTHALQATGTAALPPGVYLVRVAAEGTQHLFRWVRR